MLFLQRFKGAWRGVTGPVLSDWHKIGEDIFYCCAGVGKPRHFMLPAEFSACFHPLEKGAWGERPYFQGGECYIAIALSFVIRVDVLEVLV